MTIVYYLSAVWARAPQTGRGGGEEIHQSLEQKHCIKDITPI